MPQAKRPKLTKVNARVFEADVRALKEEARARAVPWHVLLREALHAGVVARRDSQRKVTL